MRLSPFQLFIALLVLLGWLSDFLPQGGTKLDKELDQLGDHSVEQISEAMLGNRIQQGAVRIQNSEAVITDIALNDQIKRRVPTNSRDRTLYWNLGGVESSAVSGFALDKRHYFANSYLLGFAPFEVDAAWKPLYTIASRKKYQLDELQYKKLDLWQNSAQAWLYTRGDCEDHALILADWLIEMGMDARVALGYYKNEGHAWVVVFDQQKTYVLEATDKRRHLKWSAYPLASQAVDYRAEFMFNRQYTWVKRSGSGMNYRKGWELVSQFEKGLTRG